MKRRPDGTGSVTPKSEGRFLLRWTERGERRGKVVYCSEAEAHETLDAIMRRVAKLGHETTLRDFGARWLDEQEERGRGDIAASRSRWRKHIADLSFAKMPLSTVRPRHIKRWLDDMHRGGMAQQQRRHCVYLVSGMFRAAMEEELVASNPVAAIRKPGLPNSRREVVLTREQVEALAADTTDVVRATVALALLGCCLRPGELLGLEVGDDHGDHLRVRRSGRAVRQEDRTKTGDGRRVELFGWGTLAMQRWRELRPTLKGKGWGAARSRWLFPVPPVWLQRLPLPEGVHAHDLRGTGATHLLSGTWGPPWTIADVAAFIGDSVATTERAYAHVTKGRHAELGAGIRVGSDPKAGSAKTRAISLARQARFERATFGFGGLRKAEYLSGVNPDQIQLGSKALSLALKYAAAVAEGDPHRDQRGLDLAEAVIALHCSASSAEGSR